MEIIMIAVLGLMFLLVLIGLCVFLGWKLIEARKSTSRLYESYKDIIDRDSEIAKRDQEISQLQGKLTVLQNDYSQRFQSLNDEYTKAKALYDTLKRETGLLEETLDTQSFGIYKPHYDFSTSEEYKVKLEQIREKQASLIKQERATGRPDAVLVNNSKVEGERLIRQYTKLMLRAFNGECDASVLKVRWNNVTVMEERIRKACEAVNKLGTVHKISIRDEYLDLKLEELRLAYEYQEKVYQEREEQRRIQEQMREEERAQRELDRAREEAEEEETRHQRALDKARSEMEKAKGEEVNKLNERIQLLEQQVAAAHEQKERAISQAQLTKSGYIYIISNLGSFGENVYKIGMTRRLEPMERIKELGDASVPFDFDVHAMIYSENAPELETRMQQHFKDRQVNLVNDRREFFNITIDDVEKFARESHFNVTITKVAEAKEYRETLALKTQPSLKAVARPAGLFPDSLVPAHPRVSA